MAIRDNLDPRKRKSVSQLRKEVNKTPRKRGSIRTGGMAGGNHSTRDVPEYDCPPGYKKCRIATVNPNQNPPEVPGDPYNPWRRWGCCNARNNDQFVVYGGGGGVPKRRRRGRGRR
jgi:hypothetical protein